RRRHGRRRRGRPSHLLRPHAITRPPALVRSGGPARRAGGTGDWPCGRRRDRRAGERPGDGSALGGEAGSGRPMTRPRLLFYCQHSVGLGHLVRSVNLADGLAQDFDVTLLNGGPWPAELPQPSAIDIVHLPALGQDADYALVSRDERFTVEEAVALRRSIIQECFDSTHPDVVLIELFPFG